MMMIFRFFFQFSLLTLLINAPSNLKLICLFVVHMCILSSSFYMICK